MAADQPQFSFRTATPIPPGPQLPTVPYNRGGQQYRKMHALFTSHQAHDRCILRLNGK